MEISVKFFGGPVDGQEAMTDSLDRLKCFFDDRQRLALVYVRENETDYVYDLKKSQAFTKDYDNAKAKVMATPAPSLRFYDLHEPDIDDLDDLLPEGDNDADA